MKMKSVGELSEPIITNSVSVNCLDSERSVHEPDTCGSFPSVFRCILKSHMTSKW